jgi:hypothetical protein
MFVYNTGKRMGKYKGNRALRIVFMMRKMEEVKRRVASGEVWG